MHKLSLMCCLVGEIVGVKDKGRNIIKV